MSTPSNLAISPFTMPAALAAADQILDRPVWEGDPRNLDQQAWLQSFPRRSALAARMKEIRNHATTSVQDHVVWLRAEGWDAQVSGSKPGDLLLAATLNVVAKWTEAGQARREDGVDRVLLRKGSFTSAPFAGEHPIVEVLTQNPDFSFCFQQVSEASPSKAWLADRALEMASRSAHEEVQLDFPMVDLVARDEARHMIGLHAGQSVVTQAAEQMRLELNEVGGRASAAAEIVVTRSAARQVRTIRIDGPFVVAVNRLGAPKDADKVMFAAYCDRSAWKKPAAGRI